MAGETKETRSLAMTPTWSVATVLTIFVAISLIVERSIHRLSHWLQKTNRKPLYEAVEKMKDELMLLGFISLLLTATSSTISNICIETKFFDSKFYPCSVSDVEDSAVENSSIHGRKLYLGSVHHSFRRLLISLNQNTCTKGHEPFVSYEGLEQLHRFIFVMAITHVSYSCLTMLLAIVKIHSWREWEDEANMDRHASLTGTARGSMIQRQATFVKFHTSNPWGRNSFLVWVICFFRQFGRSVVRSDYLTLRMGFIMLVLLVGTKLQHVIATLTLENAGINGFFTGTKLRPRDDLFWFKKPELLLSLIHFILFQNSFELASFFWFWLVLKNLPVNLAYSMLQCTSTHFKTRYFEWQFGYDSCFIRNHFLVYARLILGFAGQFLCSYSTLPLYALVTQMGTNYKAALIPQRIRETIHGWGKATRRKRRYGHIDDSTIHTDTSTVHSIEEDDATSEYTEIELRPVSTTTASPSALTNETSSRVGTPLLRASTSLSSSTSFSLHQGRALRSTSMPLRRG
ncbi:MLO-like protein 11 isoform X4 [Macadamia integrifolia]|uniref:MLO-like protein 11 isoform X4 n=1 Tax=Macadamia integrifolia TaxID=60698 RepID=UPI001C532735|nr:MLO-like protein 11 isoform X4 [Macadamia integrifolia]